MTVKIRARYNGNPDNGEVGYRGFTAEIEGCPDGIVGCPLGRTWANDRDEAVKDLRARVLRESGVVLDIEKIKSVGC